MERFVAFVWDPQNPACESTVRIWLNQLPTETHGWDIAVDVPGLLVAVRNRASQQSSLKRLLGHTGVIIGSLYRKSGANGSVQQLSAVETDTALRTKGATLVTEFWGSYVAIWRDQSSTDAYVVCDPCGAAACFSVASGHVRIFCSYVADIAGLSGLGLSIDWDSVRAFLVHNYFVSAHTGIGELTEILPGQRATWSDTSWHIDWLWSPITTAASPTRRPFEQNRDELRSLGEACFRDLGNSHRNIVVRVSGGLDSSIVLNLLRRVTDAEVWALHLVGRGYEANELGLARLAAQHAGVPLLELQMDLPTTDIASLESAPLLARPTKQLLGMTADHILQQTCRELGADTIMGGHGGDNLFLQRSIATDAFTDYLRLTGPGGRFWEVAYETATLLERSVWHVLHRASTHLLGLRKWEPTAFLDSGAARQERSLLANGATGIPASYTSMPWLEEARRLPPCKAEQIRGVLALRNYQSVLGHGVAFDAVHPWVSQPLVEFALCTPAYAFTHGGVDRSLERAAFGDLLPAPIRRRMNKGFVNHQLTHDLANDAPRLRAFLLDGHLMRERILDRTRTEQLLSEDNLLKGDALGAILNALAAEAWVRPWIARTSLHV